MNALNIWGIVISSKFVSARSSPFFCGAVRENWLITLLTSFFKLLSASRDNKYLSTVELTHLLKIGCGRFFPAKINATTTVYHDIIGLTEWTS